MTAVAVTAAAAVTDWRKNPRGCTHDYNRYDGCTPACGDCDGLAWEALDLAIQLKGLIDSSVPAGELRARELEINRWKIIDALCAVGERAKREKVIE